MRTRRVVLTIVAVLVLLPLALLGGVVLLVQSEWGERWLETQVSDRIHREVQVENIRVAWDWPPALRFERVRIGNPEWAQTPNLIDANDLYARIDLAPLLEKRLIVPLMTAARADMGLEISGEKATWHFSEDRQNPSRIELRRVALDDGHVVYRNENEDTALDARVKGSLGTGGEMNVEATGKFRGEPAKLTGSFPGLETNAHNQAVRFSGKGTLGATQVEAQGTVAGQRLDVLDLDLKVSGPSLEQLGKLTRVVLPDTPKYRLDGHFKRNGSNWSYDPVEGKVGDSDLAGSFSYQKGGKRPLLQADLRSKRLDFADLGPLVGTPPKGGAAGTAEQRRKVAARQQDPTKVLPHNRFETERWGRMDADVKLVADRILRPKQLPVESLKTHLILKDAVVTLDPLDFGFAGGRITSKVKLDGNKKPLEGDIRADIQNLKFAKLFPTLKTMDEALGTFYGRAELVGHGNSVGDLLGTSTGTVTIAANGGQVSQLLTELLEIDVATAVKLLGTKKQQVELRCAVGHLNVKDGVATPHDFIVDTTETSVNVLGKVDLHEEQLALETHAKGKSPSFFTLRSPILLDGPLNKPKVHVKAGPAAGQVGVAAALAAVNPALAIAPFLSRGSGKDADCKTLLAEARRDGAVKKQG